MLQRAYDWTLRMAVHPRAVLWLAIISAAESVFFPFPPDPMLAPMMMARPERAWRLAGICALASVVGGIAGYGLGYFLFEVAAAPLIDAMGYRDGFERFQALYADWGLWVILIKGLTPIPYKIVTIASGAAHYDFTTFLLASLVTRAARFYVVALLFRMYGPEIRTFVERRLALVTAGMAVVIVGGLLAIRYV